MDVSKPIVFVPDAAGTDDPAYAAAVCAAFRAQYGWVVAPGTPIHTQLTAFSRHYAASRREPVEVAVIFWLAQVEPALEAHTQEVAATRAALAARSS